MHKGHSCFVSTHFMRQFAWNIWPVFWDVRSLVGDTWFIFCAVYTSSSKLTFCSSEGLPSYFLKPLHFNATTSILFSLPTSYKASSNSNRHIGHVSSYIFSSLCLCYFLYINLFLSINSFILGKIIIISCSSSLSLII